LQLVAIRQMASIELAQAFERKLKKEKESSTGDLFTKPRNGRIAQSRRGASKAPGREEFPSQDWFWTRVPVALNPIGFQELL
jgi:hypothetical protein